MSKYVDLHVHTTASDGIDSPSSLVEKAKHLGLAAVAITDHDTVQGVTEGITAGSRFGVEVVGGVEISCVWRRHSVHLLGYYIDTADTSLIRLLERMQRGRAERLPKMLAKLRELGIHIDREDVEVEAGHVATGRPHLARVMVRQGYVASLDEAFDKYLAQGQPAYVKRVRPAIAEGIQVILKARGVPVVAHPLMTEAPLVEQLSEFVPLGLQGVEYYYPYEYVTGKPTEWYTNIEVGLRQLKQLARQHKLVVTGGSDYHGSTPNKASLGFLKVPYSTLQKLCTRYQQMHG